MLHAGQARIRSFRVVPDLPPPLAPLYEIAHNLWWTWVPEAIDLFKRLDRDLWNETHHNPVKLLGTVRQEVLDRAAADQSYLHALNMVHAAFREHTQRQSWFHRQFPHLVGAASPDDTQFRGPGDTSDGGMRIAYFCAEFGITECFQIYSGGLGCLAGDHLKSASEMGVPLCAVGLLYRCGYFHQYLNADGWQQETYPDLDFPNQPVRRLIDPATGEQYRVHVELMGRTVTIGVWRCDVGRIPVYLLDTNFPENKREDRDITRTLYGGDIETRIQQEIVLGIGGMRALEKVGEKPNVFHINEGHAAFLALERISRFRERYGLDFEPARQAAAAAHVFTTHTPVPAGIDRFSPELIERYLPSMAHRLGLDLEGLLGLGRGNPFDRAESFSMAVLALRTSNHCNGVSRLHGEVSRNMWQNIWPGVPEPEVPIEHVTNGVHPRSWISPALMKLFDRYVGPEWLIDPGDEAHWRRVNDIPDEELWRTHERQREKLITWCRRKIRKQLRARGMGHEECERAASVLSPDIFTIGFARRFATYKRGTLIMQDAERLRALFNNTEQPIQLLIAGKSHPADGSGKELIREIVKLAAEHDHLNRIVFLEDYDIDVARRLVQGCDIWLNTPKRGMEASGTSGMKAAMNGVVNVSILDGWWDEAYTPAVGYAIGKGEMYDDDKARNAIESRALYDLLERQILPEFYDRDESGLPRKWVHRMKASIRELSPRFSTSRMLADYAEQAYVVAHGTAHSLAANNFKHARELADHIHKFHHEWPHVSVRHVEADVGASVRVRSPVHVHAEVHLGGLSPELVKVQLYWGEVTSLGDLVQGSTTEMHPAPDQPRSHEGTFHFVGEFKAHGSGRRGFTVRVVPRDDRLVGTLTPGLIAWNQADYVTRAQLSEGSSGTSDVALARPGAR